jgi:hypothetical protein
VREDNMSPRENLKDAGGKGGGEADGLVIPG